LQTEVDEGRFRADLYYRLKVVPLYVPALRDRQEDILKFVNYFISTFNNKFNKNFESVSDEARSILLNYGWPGNIRELKNVIERIVLLESGNVVVPEMLPFSASRNEDSSIGRRIDSVLSQPYPDDGIDFDGLVNELEKLLIVKASDQSGWNQSRTARLLNMKRDKLRYRMKNFRIPDEKEVPSSS
jgi:DNA-binding NtrC family response regulator